MNYVDSDTIKKHEENLKQGTDAACAENGSNVNQRDNMEQEWYATLFKLY